MQTGQMIFTSTEQVVFGKPAAESVLEIAEAQDAKNVFILASHFLRNNTEEIDQKKWRVTVTGPDGETVVHEADFVFSAVGILNIPKYPHIDGLDSFPGEVVHTCRWPDSLDLSGKRVAVIGNGASAMQVVPAIADSVSELTVFARSKQWAAPFPQFQKPIPDGVRYLMQVVPLYRGWFEQRLSWTFNDRVLGTLHRDRSEREGLGSHAGVAVMQAAMQ